MSLPPVGDVMLLSVEAEDPAVLLAAVETAAAVAPENRWILIAHPWPWREKLLGSFTRPGDDRGYYRRATGGVEFAPSRDSVYAALIGPRSPPRPPSLRSVVELARRITGIMNPLLAGGPEHPVWGAAGKLAQRPLIELFGSREHVEDILRRIPVGSSEYLDSDLIFSSSVERHRSREWLMPPPRGAEVFRVERDSAYAELHIRLSEEAPLIEEAVLYTNIFVYPPGQLRVLVDQFVGSPPSRGLAFEFLNSFASLVEWFGLEYDDFRALVLGAMERLEERV